MRPVARTAYVVTCEACGQTWQLTHAEDNQLIECLFCGVRGRLQVGPPQIDEKGRNRIDARLQARGR